MTTESQLPFLGGDMPPPPPSSPGAGIKYRAFAARHLQSQIDRIERGLDRLGAVRAADDDPSVNLVYANDEPHWQEAIEYRDRVNPQAKLVLCVLDIPEVSYPNFRPGDLYERLLKADHLVTISQYVQSQVYRYYGLGSSIIYQPIKDITPDKRVAGQTPFPDYKVLMGGRLRDKGKRADLAIQSLILAGFEEKEVAVVGGEYPGWGTDLGIVSDQTLNDLYNSVTYLVMVSGFEGLGLPALEGLAGGAIPIVCHDLTTAHELFPPQWLCYPHPHSVAYRLATLQTTPEWLAADKRLALQIGHGVRERFSGEAVARRILSVAFPSSP